MTLDELVAAAHANAIAKGFHDVVPADVHRIILTLGLELQETCAEIEDARKNPVTPRKRAGIAEGLPSGPKLHLQVILVLICTEVAEALEAAQEGDIGHLMEELADVQIRLADVAGWIADHHPGAVTLADAVLAKMEKNAQRAHMHGKQA